MEGGGKMTKGKKVAKKTPHTDARRSDKSPGRSERSVYTEMNGHFQVLFPLARTKTDKKVLTAAVDSVVASLRV